jgi:hypothetical protein
MVIVVGFWDWMARSGAGHYDAALAVLTADPGRASGDLAREVSEVLPRCGPAGTSAAVPAAERCAVTAARSVSVCAAA